MTRLSSPTQFSRIWIRSGSILTTKDGVFLDQVELREFFDALPKQLDTQLDSSDYGLSVGQKQLMCHPRAILRNSKILI
jgi:ABC-type transport system involved in cytochrome bd biosynthesis fused ATPase/permease subunit